VTEPQSSAVARYPLCLATLGCLEHTGKTLRCHGRRLSPIADRRGDDRLPSGIRFSPTSFKHAPECVGDDLHTAAPSTAPGP